MKLWDKGINISKQIEKFTVGNDQQLDVLLAKYDVWGSMAHAKMLQEVDLLSKVDFENIYQELKKILHQIEKAEFKIEKGIEDIHSQIEYILIQKLGETGKRIHTGRSRNDQILLDIRLFVRDRIKEIVSYVKNLFDLLIELSEMYQEIFLPGYTHLQIAMPSSFGLWFAAYAESLADDLILLEAAFQIINKNPLGSAAGYGSSLPINRNITTRLLGFDDLNYNSVYAQMGRGKTEKVVSCALANIAATLSKLATDICLYMNQNFAFLSFPEELTTGSSIMPHKKNPDVFELIRAKCNKIQALPNEITLVTANFPSGYHRDFQILKETFLPVFDILIDCLGITHFMLSKIQINDQIFNQGIYRQVTSVEAVNQLVLKGIPFRNAYLQVANELKEGTFKPPDRIKYSHEGSIGNLKNDKIVEVMNNILIKFQFEKIEKAITGLINL
jgi:argininosuccinate lyase